MQNIIELGLKATIAFCRAMSTDELRMQGVIAFVADLKEPILNVVVHADIPEKEIDSAILAVSRFYEAHHAEWAWIIGPLTSPTTLSNHLKQKKFVLLDTFPSLYFDLANDLQVSNVHDLYIKEDLSKDLSDWIIPLKKSFPTSDEGESFRELNAKLPHGENTAFRHYVGYYQDQPVSAATLFVNGETAMIHNIATIPGFRKRGFGSAITLKVMQEAKHLGVKFCFLDSSNIGLTIYQKLGFKIYSKQELYGIENLV